LPPDRQRPLPQARGHRTGSFYLQKARRYDGWKHRSRQRVGTRQHLHRPAASQLGRIDMSTNLLIIEDNPQNAYLMRFLLEAKGFSVHIADNGRLGIQEALDLKPSAILLDIQLPEMDGYAVAAALKQHPELQSVPIIAVTSYAMVGDRE